MVGYLGYVVCQTRLDLLKTAKHKVFSDISTRLDFLALVYLVMTVKRAFLFEDDLLIFHYINDHYSLTPLPICSYLN